MYYYRQCSPTDHVNVQPAAHATAAAHGRGRVIHGGQRQLCNYQNSISLLGLTILYAVCHDADAEGAMRKRGFLLWSGACMPGQPEWHVV